MPVRIAYLVNRYPAVSHSFIRREIAAVEAAGAEVARFTIRAADGSLPDPADRADRDRTIAILAQGVPAILGATLMIALIRPARFARALGKARTLRQLAYLAEACWLARRFARRPVDWLHAHFGTNPAAVARLIHGLSGVPYSLTVHGPDEFDAPLALDLRGKIADAALAIAISDYGRGQLMRWSDPVDWAKLHVVRCGLDPDFLAAKPTAIPAAPALVTVARLSAQKGLPLLVDAAALLAGRGVAFSLTVVGEGDLRPDLEAQVARHGLSERIRFTGSLDAAGVRRELAAARVFVLPSFAEGLPVVLMEALALGRPVIATAIAGVPELVDSNCGWLIPAGSVDALADAMAAALAAVPEQLAEMAAVGRARVLERHDAAHNGAALLKLIGQAFAK